MGASAHVRATEQPQTTEPMRTITIAPLRQSRQSNLAKIATHKGHYGGWIQVDQLHARATDGQCLIRLDIVTETDTTDPILIPAVVWKAFQNRKNKEPLIVSVPELFSDQLYLAVIGQESYRWAAAEIEFPHTKAIEQTETGPTNPMPALGVALTRLLSALPSEAFQLMPALRNPAISPVHLCFTAGQAWIQPVTMDC